MSSQSYYLMVVAVVLVLIGAISAKITTPLYIDKAQDILGMGTQKGAINDLKLNLEIADTAVKRQKGLSGRNKLKKNQGLLFIFEQSGLHGIWMNKMKFSIDVLWLDSNLRIVDLMEKVDPETYPTVFVPNQPAMYILEINSGMIENYNINYGDILKLN